MINLILFGSFFVMLLLNIPIAVSLGMSSIFALLFSSSPLTVVPTNVYSGMAKFLLLAIPFFVLSGNIMAKAGISSRLVAFADDCVGHRRGGIAIVAVIVACFFGAISGSGPATVAALGIILIPAMINRGGFSAPFASSLMASASSIAIVIPPLRAVQHLGGHLRGRYVHGRLDSRHHDGPVPGDHHHDRVPQEGHPGIQGKVLLGPALEVLP